MEGHNPQTPQGSVCQWKKTLPPVQLFFFFFCLCCLPELLAAGQSTGGFAEFPGVAGFTVPLGATVSKVLSLNCGRIFCWRGGEFFKLTAIDEARPAEWKPGRTDPGLLVSTTQRPV